MVSGKRIIVFKADIEEKTVHHWLIAKGDSPLYMNDGRSSWLSLSQIKDVLNSKIYCSNLIYSMKCPLSHKFFYYTINGYPEKLAELFLEHNIIFSVYYIFPEKEKEHLKIFEPKLSPGH